MALAKRGQQRFATGIWPGFVDAMTALLLVLMFVLTIFMVVQSVLRDTISTQDHALDALQQQIAGLADALGLERDRTADLQASVTGLSADLAAAGQAADAQSRLIATLNATLAGQAANLDAAAARITSFEAQVASLLSERDTARGEVADLSARQAELMSAQDALNLALAKARHEIDAGTEAARLAAAKREAMEALIADIRARAAAESAEAATLAAGLQADLSEAEKQALVEAAAAAALRARLGSAEDELTAMTLALEGERKRAEETLTLLAAAEAARRALDATLATRTEALSEAEKTAALLALGALKGVGAEAMRGIVAARAQAASAEAARKVALLNQQITALRAQLGSLQGMLDASAAQDAEAKVQIEALGGQLNSALARVAAEERKRADLEAAERARLEEEAKQLSRYRSDFFAKLSEVLAGREGVRVVGDRFVLSSEVLFEPGSADLAEEGRAQIAGVVASLLEVAGDIPPEIDWIIRVDGHTDNLSLSGSGAFADNWELSQGRALSVVRFMQDELGFPPERLAATGFGEFQPVAAGDDPQARAQNRRIELKLTER